MLKNLEPFFNDQSIEDLDDYFVEFSDEIKQSQTSVKYLYSFSHVSDRVMDFLHTLFTYTNMPLKHSFDIEDTSIQPDSVLLIQGYQDREKTLRWFAKELACVKPFDRLTIWVDLQRFPKDALEQEWLENFLDVADIVTCATDTLEVSIQRYMKEGAVSKTVETIPTTVFKPVKSSQWFEKRSRHNVRNEPTVLWTGNLWDIQNLSYVLEKADYPIRFCPKDDYGFEHPKLEKQGRTYRHMIHYADYLLITQSPDDPYYELLFKEALLEGVIPLVDQDPVPSFPLKEYCYNINNFKGFMDLFQTTMFTFATQTEKMLLEGQTSVVQMYSPQNFLEGLIDLSKASELIVTNKKRK